MRKINFKGQNVLICEDKRISDLEIDNNLYLYKLRHKELDWSKIDSIEEQVVANYYGFLVSLEPIHLNEKMNNFRYKLLSEKESDKLSYEGKSIDLKVSDLKNIEKIKNELVLKEEGKDGVSITF